MRDGMFVRIFELLREPLLRFRQCERVPHYDIDLDKGEGMWRLKYLVKELFTIRPEMKEILEQPWRYKAAMLQKFIHANKSPVTLRLRGGGVVHVREFMTLFVFREIFVDGCYDVPLGKRPMVIDVGANTGLFALRAKKLWPHARIHCYEPYWPNTEQLRETIRTNELDDVAVFPEGVGGAARTATLNVHPRNIGGHSIMPFGESTERVEITIVDLKEVLRRTPAGWCDLLKLDCEGAEREILLSMDRQIASKIQRVVYEYSAGGGAKEVEAHLTSLGYSLRREGDLFHARRPNQSGADVLESDEPRKAPISSIA